MTPLTDADVLRLVTHTTNPGGYPVAYGTLHFLEEANLSTVDRLFSGICVDPADLEREDVGWLRKIVAAMPEDDEGRREYKARYTKRIEELSRG